MPSRRYRRFLSLLASLLWLVTGVTDAAGLAVCTYHGHREYHGTTGGEPAAETPQAPAGHDSSTHHSSHGHTAPSAVASDVATVGEHAHGDALMCAMEDAAGHHGCDCRFMCSLGVGDDSPPQPPVSAVADSSPETPEPPRPASVGTQLSFHIVPFLLPPSIAPPIS